ncbi:hypothetical protein [Streptomyces sp. NRRL S-104]|uniref:hypothetical protein n=1 Tax=Streptomyces sp. NRRL S-104 TaxID=1609135 RepID=UPI003B639C24
MRVCASAEERFGRRALGEIFTAVGTRFHLPGDRGNLTGGTGRRRAAAGDRGGRRFHRLRRAVRSSHAQAVAESPGPSPPTPAEASSPGCGVHGADLR